jgi:hypothetical protein
VSGGGLGELARRGCAWRGPTLGAMSRLGSSATGAGVADVERCSRTHAEPDARDDDDQGDDDDRRDRGDPWVRQQRCRARECREYGRQGATEARESAVELTPHRRSGATQFRGEFLGAMARDEDPTQHAAVGFGQFRDAVVHEPGELPALRELER